MPGISGRLGSGARGRRIGVFITFALADGQDGVARKVGIVRCTPALVEHRATVGTHRVHMLTGSAETDCVWLVGGFFHRGGPAAGPA